MEILDLGINHRLHGKNKGHCCSLRWPVEAANVQGHIGLSFHLMTHKDLSPKQKALHFQTTA